MLLIKWIRWIIHHQFELESIIEYLRNNENEEEYVEFEEEEEEEEEFKEEEENCTDDEIMNP